jgi:hypothetical protein
MPNSIESVIAKKQQEIAQLKSDIEALERARALMGSTSSGKRRGRPPGSKNKAAGNSGKKR